MTIEIKEMRQGIVFILFGRKKFMEIVNPKNKEVANGNKMNGMRFILTFAWSVLLYYLRHMNAIGSKSFFIYTTGTLLRISSRFFIIIFAAWQQSHFIYLAEYE